MINVENIEMVFFAHWELFLTGALGMHCVEKWDSPYTWDNRRDNLLNNSDLEVYCEHSEMEWSKIMASIVSDPLLQKYWAIKTK